MIYLTSETGHNLQNKNRQQQQVATDTYGRDGVAIFLSM